MWILRANFLGLILYNGHKRNEPNNDFISLSLSNAVPVFRINLGSGVTVLRADKPVRLGKWHTIKVTRNRKKGTTHSHQSKATLKSLKKTISLSNHVRRRRRPLHGNGFWQIRRIGPLRTTIHRRSAKHERHRTRSGRLQGIRRLHQPLQDRFSAPRYCQRGHLQVGNNDLRNLLRESMSESRSLPGSPFQGRLHLHLSVKSQRTELQQVERRSVFAL